MEADCRLQPFLYIALSLHLGERKPYQVLPGLLYGTHASYLIHCTALISGGWRAWRVAASSPDRCRSLYWLHIAVAFNWKRIGEVKDGWCFHGILVWCTS